MSTLYYSIYAPYSGKRTATNISLSAQILDHMSFSFMQMGDLEMAADAAQKAVQKAPNAERQYRLAHILRRKKDSSAAQLFRFLTKQGGIYAERAQWALAEMAWEKGQWKNFQQKLLHLQALNGSYAGRATQLLPIVEQIVNKELHAFAEKKVENADATKKSSGEKNTSDSNKVNGENTD